MSFVELRRALASALLAAACGSQHGTTPPPTPGADAAARVVAAPDAAAAAKQCRHDPPDITGCGGAEVKLHDSLADCGLPAEGDLSADRCAELCKGFDTRACHVWKDRSGAPEVYCEAANPCMGRPTSDGTIAARAGDGVVDHLALARALEAHSVIAFRELEADLVRFGAPAALVAACRVAAADETRHARVMARLLRARGVTPAPVTRPRAGGFASLRALALHNEREGVIGESWGALVAMHQAAHAADADVRDAMRTIGDEETAHAALSIELAAWLRTQLDDGTIAELDDARRGALDGLRGSWAGGPIELGFPTAPAARAMIDVLAPALA